jgi:hypothetical protein
LTHTFAEDSNIKNQDERDTAMIHRCANYNNLQLLTETETLCKGDSFTPVEETAYAAGKGGMVIVEIEKGLGAAGDTCACTLCE